MTKNVIIFLLVLFLVVGCLNQGQPIPDEPVPVCGPDAPVLFPNLTPDGAADHLDVYQFPAVAEVGS